MNILSTSYSIHPINTLSPSLQLLNIHTLSRLLNHIHINTSSRSLHLIKRHPHLLKLLHINRLRFQFFGAFPRFLSSICAFSRCLEHVGAPPWWFEVMIGAPPWTAVSVRRRFLDRWDEFLQMADVIGIKLEIAVVSSFDPKRFVFLFAKLPKLLPVTHINHFIRCALEFLLNKLFILIVKMQINIYNLLLTYWSVKQKRVDKLTMI